MALDIGLEFEDPWLAKPMPKIIRHSRRDDKKLYRNMTTRNSKFENLDSDFLELRISTSPIPQRKSMPCGSLTMRMDNNDLQKRGSMYHSSSEVRRLRKLKAGRSTLEMASNEDAFLSFEIVNPASKSGRGKAVRPQKNRSPLASLNTEESSLHIGSNSTFAGPMEFLDLSFRHLPEAHLGNVCSDLDPPKTSSSDTLQEIAIPHRDSTCLLAEATPNLLPEGTFKDDKSKTHGHENKISALNEIDLKHTLPKSFSTKMTVFESPCQTERALTRANTKPQFSPLKKVLDPIIKSKSLRSTTLIGTEIDGLTSPNLVSGRRIELLQKSLSLECEDKIAKVDCGGRAVRRDQTSVCPASPAHLRGTLKLEFKHGVPSFEFFVRDREDVLWARTWKTDNACNWVYTFHSSKRKGNSNGKIPKDKHKHSTPTIGQMHVSCYLCSQGSESGCLDNSIVTEFVLYDIARARRSISEEGLPHCCVDSINPYAINSMETRSLLNPDKHPCPSRQASNDSDVSTSRPWSSADLHPNHEIAAVLMQSPFDKDFSKDKIVEDTSVKSNLSSVTFDRGRNIALNRSHTSVEVITPSGNHGMPSNGDGCPSPLLDRYRYGGGCDCGGWDMACPLIVFDKPCHEGAVCPTTSGRSLPEVLYVRGSKEKVPALTITGHENGNYSVEFHAQLSALQAFAICISILHTSEASSVAGQEKDIQSLYSRSLKLLIEEELKNLIDAVTQERKRKAKKQEKTPLVLLLDPPFSPMGRV